MVMGAVLGTIAIVISLTALWFTVEILRRLDADIWPARLSHARLARVPPARRGARRAPEAARERRDVVQAAASRRGKQVAFYCGEALGGGRP